MALTLRRRLRAAAFGALARAAGAAPEALVRGSLLALAGLARHSRFEQRTLANLELVHGASQTRAQRLELACAVRRHAARQVQDWLRLARVDPARPATGRWIEELVRLDDSFAILEREVARGRGLLVVTAHLGDWELLCARLVRAGLRGAVIGYERANDPASRFFGRMRAAYGVRTIRQHEGARAALAVLRAGEVLGLLTDLEVRRLHGEFVPFLGRPALTMSAPAALARAAGVPLLPVRCTWRAAEGCWRLAVEEPLELDLSLARRAAQIDLLRRQNEVFGRWIRADPEQWAWHQPRWRTRPGDVLATPALRARTAVSLQSTDRGLGKG